MTPGFSVVKIGQISQASTPDKHSQVHMTPFSLVSLALIGTCYLLGTKRHLHALYAHAAPYVRKTLILVVSPGLAGVCMYAPGAILL
jgi:hypothetical protein